MTQRSEKNVSNGYNWLKRIHNAWLRRNHQIQQWQGCTEHYHCAYAYPIIENLTELAGTEVHLVLLWIEPNRVNFALRTSSWHSVSVITILSGEFSMAVSRFSEHFLSRLLALVWLRNCGLRASTISLWTQLLGRFVWGFLELYDSEISKNANKNGSWNDKRKNIKSSEVSDILIGEERLIQNTFLPTGDDRWLRNGIWFAVLFWSLGEDACFEA